MVTARAHLWFGNNKAVEAARFYEANIPNSAVTSVLVAPEGVPGVASGGDFVVEFTVAGMEMIGLNAGPEFKLDEAFSIYLRTEGQEETDRYWDILTSDGGEAGPCGWCKDKFGVSWQVIPVELEKLCGDYTTEANQRAMSAMLQMGKIDVAELQAAYDAA